MVAMQQEAYSFGNLTNLLYTYYIFIKRFEAKKGHGLHCYSGYPADYVLTEWALSSILSDYCSIYLVYKL